MKSIMKFCSQFLVFLLKSLLMVNSKAGILKQYTTGLTSEFAKERMVVVQFNMSLLQSEQNGKRV